MSRQPGYCQQRNEIQKDDLPDTTTLMQVRNLETDSTYSSWHEKFIQPLLLMKIGGWWSIISIFTEILPATIGCRCTLRMDRGLPTLNLLLHHFAKNDAVCIIQCVVDDAQWISWGTTMHNVGTLVQSIFPAYCSNTIHLES